MCFVINYKGFFSVEPFKRDSHKRRAPKYTLSKLYPLPKSNIMTHI